MPLYLVRHAKAGNRSKWVGPDALRPLTKSGREQADRFAAELADEPVTRILSSPYVRCVQTVEPLARKRGLEVEPVGALAEAGPFEPVLGLLAGLPDHSVICSHGDLIPDTLNALIRRGMEVVGEPDFRKGSWWVLHRDGDAVVRGEAHAPLA
jgi:phosphohistidine phosphatase SixA